MIHALITTAVSTTPTTTPNGGANSPMPIANTTTME